MTSAPKWATRRCFAQSLPTSRVPLRVFMMNRRAARSLRRDEQRRGAVRRCSVAARLSRARARAIPICTRAVHATSPLDDGDTYCIARRLRTQTQEWWHVCSLTRAQLNVDLRLFCYSDVDIVLTRNSTATRLRCTTRSVPVFHTYTHPVDYRPRNTQTSPKFYQVPSSHWMHIFKVRFPSTFPYLERIT